LLGRYPLKFSNLIKLTPQVVAVKGPNIIMQSESKKSPQQARSPGKEDMPGGGSKLDSRKKMTRKGIVEDQPEHEFFRVHKDVQELMDVANANQRNIRALSERLEKLSENLHWKINMLCMVQLLTIAYVLLGASFTPQDF